MGERILLSADQPGRVYRVSGFVAYDMSAGARDVGQVFTFLCEDDAGQTMLIEEHYGQSDYDPAPDLSRRTLSAVYGTPLARAEAEAMPRRAVDAPERRVEVPIAGNLGINFMQLNPFDMRKGSADEPVPLIPDRNRPSAISATAAATNAQVQEPTTVSERGQTVMNPNSKGFLIITIFLMAAAIGCFAQGIVGGGVICAIFAALGLLARVRSGKGK